MNFETQYLELCSEVLKQGSEQGDRTGTGTLSLSCATLRHDLSLGFPLLTTKKINPALPIGELLWMLSGSTDLPSLRKYQNKPEGSHTIWSDDYQKYEDLGYGSGEDLGNIYGKQLRSFSSEDCGEFVCHDQLTTLLENIKVVVKNPEHPMGRRLRCSFWNPYDHTVGDKITCALPACHTDFQCLVREGKLHLQYSMRSNDLFLGKPFNMVFYATLCHILARLTGLEVGEVIYFGVDVHIYKNHINQVHEMLSREPMPLPSLMLPEFSTLEELLQLTGEDFIVEDYNPHGFIKAPQAS